MKNFFGEFIGTFLLVFIGCGSVGWAIFIESLDLWQIALIWGGGVAIAIYSSMSFSHAHLNPAVSMGFLIDKSIGKKELFNYLTGQFVGAFVAAVALYYCFESHFIVKDVHSAMMFGEYYPNPGNADLKELSTTSAFALEGLGTFLLMFGILMIDRLDLKRKKLFNPLLVGLLLSILIFCIAPYTQAGFNPARDFSPRLLSYFFGWDSTITFRGSGWLSVYMIAPIVGALLAALLMQRIKKRAERRTRTAQ